MKFSSSASTSVVLLKLLSVQLQVGVVQGGGGNTISVEPYLADWCAAQFPDQITNYNGYDHARLVKERDYVRIEPFLGEYCFEQFPTELAGINRVNTLLGMKNHHYVQIEPYLKEWGDASFQTGFSYSDSGGGDLVKMEPFVAKWCAYGQFRDQFPTSTVSQSLSNAESKGHVKIETVFGKWCFAQFPRQLGGLQQDETIAKIPTDHVRAELYLILWQAAEYNFQQHVLPKLTSVDSTEKAILGFLISMFVIGFIMVLVWCWRCKTAREVQQFQNHVAATATANEVA